MDSTTEMDVMDTIFLPPLAFETRTVLAGQPVIETKTAAPEGKAGGFLSFCMTTAGSSVPQLSTRITIKNKEYQSRPSGDVRSPLAELSFALC